MSSGAVAYSSAYYGQGYGAIFLDNVACSGTETMLIDCISSSNIGIHNCQHYADAGVKCQGTEKLWYDSNFYFCNQIKVLIFQTVLMVIFDWSREDLKEKVP